MSSAKFGAVQSTLCFIQPVSSVQFLCLPASNALNVKVPDIRSGSLSNIVVDDFQSRISHILEPCQLLNLGSFITRTLMPNR